MTHKRHWQAEMVKLSLKSKEVGSLRLTIRAPTIDELSSLSDLCFRSKAVWGYDEEFMEACRGELSFEPRDLALTPIAVAEHNGKPIGVAQVKVVDRKADLLKLFVEPSALRSGTGEALLVWATDVAKKLGATQLTIDADPDAAPFYRRMGAYDVGEAPSASVPGRMLPKLAMNLCPADLI
jgi:GNAT superfamily N-acetyltransferase